MTVPDTKNQTMKPVVMCGIDTDKSSLKINPQRIDIQTEPIAIAKTGQNGPKKVLV